MLRFRSIDVIRYVKTLFCLVTLRPIPRDYRQVHNNQQDKQPRIEVLRENLYIVHFPGTI